MRKIKFKGFNTKKGFTREYQLSEMLVEKIENNGLDRLWLQYTGLKDKNGREIYEGDIVRMVFGKNGKTRDIEVKWKDGGFFPRTLSNRKWEVIGNIYESTL